VRGYRGLKNPDSQAAKNTPQLQSLFSGEDPWLNDSTVFQRRPPSHFLGLVDADNLSVAFTKHVDNSVRFDEVWVVFQFVKDFRYQLRV
jgi:hypothetical protein